MSRALGHPIAKCCDMLGVVGSSLKMVKFFIQHEWMLRMMLHMFGQVRATMLHHGSGLLLRFTTPNGSQQGCQMMLRYVAFKCCYRFFFRESRLIFLTCSAIKFSADKLQSKDWTEIAPHSQCIIL